MEMRNINLLQKPYPAQKDIDFCPLESGRGQNQRGSSCLGELLMWAAIVFSVDWGCPVVALYRLTGWYRSGNRICFGSVGIKHSSQHFSFMNWVNCNLILKPWDLSYCSMALPFPGLATSVHLASVYSWRWRSVPWEKVVVNNPQPDDINWMLKCTMVFFFSLCFPLPPSNISRWNWSS